MVAIARAVSFKAQLVIMDEPTSSLDEREVAVLFDVMRRLRAEGVAVIFITHRLDELYQVCDRVTVMRDGRTITTRRWPRSTSFISSPPCSAATSRRCAATRPASPPRPATAGDEVLSAEGLRIGRRVRDARVEVRAGQIVGLAGLLGSGRTETARAIFGADPPDAGSIRLMGKAVAPREPADAIAHGRRLLQRGPQGRRHRARHVGAREPDARDPAAARRDGRGRRGPPARRSSTGS